MKEIINQYNYSEDELIPTAEQIAASRHSQVNGDVQVEGGRLLITDKAVLSVTGTTTVRNGVTLAIKGGQFEGDVVMSDDCHLELSFSAENADKPLINGYVDWRAVGTFDEDYNYGDYIETKPIALKLGLADVDTPDGRYLLISGGSISTTTVWN
ncbi:MAG: hypothetical protein Q4F40_04860 [Akkermansia sp.]|nr:hypothetical protein [Akkermansia sp.]